MSRTTTIWQSWDSNDPAESDSFYPTKAELLADNKKSYGTKGAGKPPPDGPPHWLQWEVPGEGGYAITVYARPLEVELNGEGICRAMKTWPNR